MKADAAAGARLFDFYATTIPGLEPVVADELVERLPGIEAVRVQRGRRQGRVSFSYQRSPRHLLEVRSARGLYALLAEIDGITVGRPGLERIAAALAGLSLTAAGRLLVALQPDAEPSSFQLNATVQGPHRFTAADLTRAVEEAFRRGGLQRRPVATAMHLQLQVEGRRAHLGLHLPSPAARDGEPLAYCLGRLSGIGPEDAVLVVRGGRRWLRELATAFGPRLLLGFGDEPIRQPAGTVIPTDPPRLLALGEHLPLHDGSMSCILGLAGDPRLAEVREYLRCLAEGGMAALVVGDAQRLVTMLRQHQVPVSVLATLPVSLNGRDRTVFVLGQVESGHQDALPDTELLQIE